MSLRCLPKTLLGFILFLFAGSVCAQKFHPQDSSRIELYRATFVRERAALGSAFRTSCPTDYTLKADSGISGKWTICTSQSGTGFRQIGYYEFEAKTYSISLSDDQFQCSRESTKNLFSQIVGAEIFNESNVTEQPGSIEIIYPKKDSSSGGLNPASFSLHWICDKQSDHKGFGLNIYDPVLTQKLRDTVRKH